MELNLIQHEFVDILSQSIDTGVIRHEEFEINCDTFFDQDYQVVDIRKEPSKHVDMFRKLKEFSGPSLYHWKLDHGFESLQIIRKYSKYRNQPGSRATHYCDEIMGFNFNSLYVGKVKQDLSGRIITHLGVSKSVGTAGLQLYHWAPSLGLNLRLKCFEFIPEMADLISNVELAYARRNTPMIGMHR